MKALALAFLLTSLSAHVLAQTQTTGPILLSNRIAWSMADGATVAAAQAYEARVRVDGAATAIVLSGVTCVANSITDPSGAVWSFGPGQAPSIQILRNGTQAAAAFGARLALIAGVIYLQGDDYSYFRWSGTAFPQVTASDPTPATIDAAASSRWNCSAHPPSPLIRALNVVGPHKLFLRLYDTAAKIESSDSSPFDLVAPVTVMAPIRVQIEVK